ncbi:hypothetical protein MJG53_017281, partial [Ovis ammon polii x Ovis aries]
TNTYEEQVSSLCVSPPPALTLVHFPPISFPYCFRHITCSEILGHVLLQRWDLNCPQLSEEEPGLLSPPAQQHESSMTGRPQEKPPEPGPHLNQLLQKSRCEQHLFTTVAFGPSLSPGEDVKPLALHMRGRGQQEHLAAATVTDMSAVE